VLILNGCIFNIGILLREYEEGDNLALSFLVVRHANGGPFLRILAGKRSTHKALLYNSIKIIQKYSPKRPGRLVLII
jgi:hypothetical protein